MRPPGARTDPSGSMGPAGAAYARCDGVRHPERHPWPERAWPMMPSGRARLDLRLVRNHLAAVPDANEPPCIVHAIGGRGEQLRAAPVVRAVARRGDALR